MAQWGTSDAATNSVSYVASNVKLTPNTANKTALYGNTTSGAFVSGIKIGQFAADYKEVASNPAIAHTGWILRREGTGGRAGRITYETLVAGNIVTDASDDTNFPDYVLSFKTNPSNASGNSTADQIVVFSVLGKSKPTGATITYLWQKWNGSAFANLSNAGAYSNTGTANLSVLSNTASNGEIYRAMISATGANTVAYSTNSVLTVTT